MALFADATNNLQTGDAGQAQVNDGQVDGILSGHEQAFISFSAGINLVTLGQKLVADLVPEGYFIFNNQQAHGVLVAGGNTHDADTFIGGQDLDAMLTLSRFALCFSREYAAAGFTLYLLYGLVERHTILTAFVSNRAMGKTLCLPGRSGMGRSGQEEKQGQ
jgi:hypothetical protein